MSTRLAPPHPSTRYPSAGEQAPTRTRVARFLATRLRDAVTTATVGTVTAASCYLIGALMH